MSIKDIIDKAQKLNKKDQYLIIQSLLESLESPKDEVEQLWIEESEKRLEAIQSGEMKTHSIDEVFNKLL